MGPSHLEWVPPERFDEYRLVKALGRGSMGQVWLAQDTVLDRLVAVKFIAEIPAHTAARQRFLTEARAAARVQHSNIITVYRIGEIGPRPYLISEYVRGRSLDQLARPVAWPRLLEIAIGLARGLAAAHHQGVLHRDLKPANAILSETSEVKLLDFGLAKLLPHVAPPDPDAPPDREAAASDGPRAPGHPRREPRPSLGDRPTRTVEPSAGAPASVPGSGIALPSVTTTGAVMGTPAYMPPEAWRGEPATPRSDVYSLGAMLYELAADAPPHSGDSPERIRHAVLAGEAPPLASAVPWIDPRFAAAVDRCLRRDPGERFASGDAVRVALEAVAGDKPAAIRYARPSRARRLRRPRPAVLTGAALVLALTAYNHFGEEDSPPAIGSAASSCPAGMVPVPAGTFEMGSPEGEGDPDEHPQHAVTLSAYCIDKTEVTVVAYAACVAVAGCSAAPLTVHWTDYSAEMAKRNNRWCNGKDRPDHPINCVDWEQAAAYCRWKGERLPTEAEWEYVARGGDDRVHAWGNEPPSARRLNVCGSECLAAYQRNAIQVHGRSMHDGNDGWETTAPVGSYPEGASPFGALDMAGNVWEWTADWYGAYAKRAETDPRGPAAGTSRVSRGGGWATIDPNKARTADRAWLTPTTRDVDLGFRCARGK
jgi:formylglycine-generating enzyme required for sulfatase activity/serine/threonine protein kinase